MLRLFSSRSQMTSKCGKNKKSGARAIRRVCHWRSYHILMSSVNYCWTGALQHAFGISPRVFNLISSWTWKWTLNMKYWVENEINSLSNHVLFCLLYKHLPNKKKSTVFTTQKESALPFISSCITIYYMLCLDVSVIKPWIKMIPVKWYDIIQMSEMISYHFTGLNCPIKEIVWIWLDQWGCTLYFSWSLASNLAGRIALQFFQRFLVLQLSGLIFFKRVICNEQIITC